MKVEGVAVCLERLTGSGPWNELPKAETRAWARPPAAGQWGWEGARTPERHRPVTRGSQTATSASSSPRRSGRTQLQGDRARTP